jgi:UDP-3-O-[3-hydroxymyristoyl] glucosamine N-acyltransferase
MSTTTTAKELCSLVAGTLKGNPDLQIKGVNSLKFAGPEDASFLSNIKYKKQMEGTKAGLVLVNKDYSSEPAAGQTFILCENPDFAFSKVCQLFAPEPINYAPGVHPSAVVHPTAKLGANVHVGALAVIDENAVIGDGTAICAKAYVGREVKIGKVCVIHPQVSVMHRCILGNKVILHSGTVIGADGFGYTPGPMGLIKIPQNGIVQIDDDVEIGANTTVDRARFGKTWIKSGVKIDNLVQVAHNVVVGEFSVLVSQCGIAGSAELGMGVIVAAQAGVNGHISLGDGARLAGMSGAEKSIPAGGTVLGLPAEPEKEYFERHMLPRKVRKLVERVTALEGELKALKG